MNSCEAEGTIYLLCKDGEEPFEVDVIGWGGDREKLEKLAIEKEWQDYESRKRSESPLLSPDERTYRAYSVVAVEEIV